MRRSSSELEFEITGFGGMDNIEDAARLKGPVVGNPAGLAECAQIVNFDVNDSYSGTTRQGTSKIYTGVPHSLDPNGTGYFVDGSFKLLLPDYTSASLCSLKSPLNPMSYAPVNYLTVCSNSVDLFMAQAGVITPFSVPTENFKEAIQPAQIVFFFGRRLYYAVGNVLYYSDADNIEQADTRDAPFVFNSPITMGLPLDNGIYIGADKVYWLAGRAPEDFVINGIAYDGQVVKGTDVAIEGALANLSGKWGMFTAFDGVCLCSDNGQVNNLTLKKISFRNGQQGASLVKQSAGLLGNINQYISWV